MKAELRLAPHEVLPGQNSIEVWWNGEMIAVVAGADGPGVRVISKYPLQRSGIAGPVNVVEVIAEV